jgi:putative transposase
MFSQQIGLKSVTTPFRNPHINGIAESFVKTLKCGYVSWMPNPDVPTAP